MSAGYNNPQAEYEHQSFGYDASSASTGFQNTDVSFGGSSASSIPSKTSFFSNSSQVCAPSDIICICCCSILSNLVYICSSLNMKILNKCSNLARKSRSSRP